MARKTMKAPSTPQTSSGSKKGKRPLFPVVGSWPKKPTKQELERVVKAFEGRSEGCID